MSASKHNQTEQTRDVPARACLLDAAGTLEFAEPAENGDEARVPVKMLVRSAEPIEHWYWGRVIHDMKGMSLRKPTAPIDYCHEGQWSSNELLGVARTFSADEQTGLTVEGELFSTRPDDRAADVIAKGQAGVPFESSLDFRGPGLVVEEVGEGATAQVNGETYDGPVTVIRKWPLRSVAVCPFGADSHTQSAFKDKADEQVSVTFLHEESAMSDKSKATPPADDARELADGGKPAEGQPPAGDEQTGSNKFREELKRFTDAFGAENGVKWFAENRSYEQALEEHVKSLTARDVEQRKELDQLNEKMKSLSTGEGQPVDTGSSGEAPSKTWTDLFAVRGRQSAEQN